MAPIELGSIAAGLQRSRCSEVSSPRDRSRTWISSPESNGFSTCRRVEDGSGRYAPNPQCRSITRVGSSRPLAHRAQEITLGETFGLAGADAGDAAFSVDAQAIVTRVRCVNCGSVREVGGRLLGRLLLAACRRCGGVMMPAATDACDELSRSAADPGWLERPLAAFGVVDGDVISLRVRDSTTHYELGRSSTEEV